MNENCQTCKVEKLCVYEYKPCDCRDHIKFVAHKNLIQCEDCEGAGTKPWPLKCNKCNGIGAYLKDVPNVLHKGRALARPA